MIDYSLEELARFSWMVSRIPALPGLVATVPDSPAVDAVCSIPSDRPSRWYPEDGGHRVVVLYEPPFPYDSDYWQVEQGVWDHEHCNCCNANIPAMTLCWVTEVGPYVLLCERCHDEVAKAAGLDV